MSTRVLSITRLERCRVCYIEITIMVSNLREMNLLIRAFKDAHKHEEDAA
jgi:hypothetical protein